MRRGGGVSPCRRYASASAGSSKSTLLSSGFVVARLGGSCFAVATGLGTFSVGTGVPRLRIVPNRSFSVSSPVSSFGCCVTFNCGTTDRFAVSAVVPAVCGLPRLGCVFRSLFDESVVVVKRPKNRNRHPIAVATRMSAPRSRSPDFWSRADSTGRRNRAANSSILPLTVVSSGSSPGITASRCALGSGFGSDAPAGSPFPWGSSSSLKLFDMAHLLPDS